MKKIHDEVHHFEAECTGSDKKTPKVEPKQKQIKVSGMKDLQKLDHEHTLAQVSSTHSSGQHKHCLAIVKSMASSMSYLRKGVGKVLKSRT